jgi:chorismate mutase
MVAAVGISLSLVLSANGAIALADDSGPLTKLVDDAAARLQTADPVAASKYLTGGSVDDRAREQQVIDVVTKAATDAHVDPGFVHDVFRDQIDATDSLEHSRFATWKIDPSSAPKTAPDLSSSRDVINALNDAIVQDIAAGWTALHAPTCSTDVGSALAHVVAERHLDALYQQALRYAVHRYCR